MIKKNTLDLITPEIKQFWHDVIEATDTLRGYSVSINHLGHATIFTEYWRNESIKVDARQNMLFDHEIATLAEHMIDIWTKIKHNYKP